ncbi:hypothetical protein PGT21_020591 [Puccinia graminis f. sp. tritici]|uniref:Uncharacterized protein n=1 Tax=Puccinia graminis f. sp. tritici TaxID=56615 RepID=A0A5B0NCQ1_PUCGR|nr:hypothetical protein PGT21_020591 [Puccinia graminis f. sp. tritici]
MVKELDGPGSFPWISKQTEIRPGIFPAGLHSLAAVHGQRYSDSDQPPAWTPLRPVWCCAYSSAD